MLNKQNRLTTNSSFIATYHQNKVVSDEFFVLHAGKSKQSPDIQTKIGFVVSKKINKRAVVRNKIKRRLREAMYAYLKENNPPYLSLIFTAKPNSNKANFQDTLKSVNKLIQRIANKRV